MDAVYPTSYCQPISLYSELIMINDFTGSVPYIKATFSKSPRDRKIS